MLTIIPVVLSGGSGTRLWPLSRKQRPKQFIPLVGEKSLFQMTLERLQDHAEISCPLIVCNEEHRFMVAEQLREINVKTQGIILEPIGRNTAPAITLAALYLKKQNLQKDTLLLVLPADHIIQNLTTFYQAINTAIPLAQQGNLVTFGIVPHSPETGYGYIQHGTQHHVRRFVEKPDLITAQSYLASGDYLWNSGMFMFDTKTYLEELDNYQSEILKFCGQSLEECELDKDFIRVNAAKFRQSPDISIDYAVMEKTDKAKVIPLDAGWNDVGAWSAVWEVGKANESGNVLRGDVLSYDSTNNLIYSEQRLVAVVGVHDLVVVDTKDATLVAHKDHVQQVKQIVDQLNVLCEAYNAQYGRQYVSVMPTNLYGSNDNYDLETSHVLPALLRKAHEAKLRGDKELVVWGTGTPRREFLYVDDLADACVFLMEQGYAGSLLNIGTGQDVTIRELAETIMDGGADCV